MPLGGRSMKVLAECEQRIQDLILEVAADVDAGVLAPLVIDMTVLCGYRNEADQEDAFRRGASKLHWPESAHNHKPARAVDVAPYPYVQNDTRRAELLRGYIAAKARQRGIKLKLISWDAPHIEPTP